MTEPGPSASLDSLLRALASRVDEVIAATRAQELLLDAVVTMAADLSLESVLQRIASVASDLVDCQYAAIGVIGPDRGLRAFVHHGVSDAQREMIGDLPSGRGLLGHLIDAPEPLRLSDIQAHPDSSGFPPHHPPMSTFLGVPVRIRDQVFGNLYLTDKRGGEAFTAEDERTVIALAAAAGVVIENARLYAESSQRERWLAEGYSAAAELWTVGAGTGLPGLAERVCALAGADAVAVVSGAGPVESVVGDTDLASRLLDGGGDELLEALAVCDGYVAHGKPAFPAYAVMVVPMRVHGSADRTLVLVWDEDHRNEFHDLAPGLPQGLADQAAQALALAAGREDRSRLALFEDRDRIGRDLHDLVIQRLFAIGLGLEGSADQSSDPEASQRMSEAVDEIDATIRDIRRTIFGLGAERAPGDLRTALGDCVARAGELLGFRPRLVTEGPVDALVTSRVRGHLMAVVEEALSNVVRHAQATAVTVTVRAGDEVVLVVADDGNGLPVDVTPSGLRNMRERALSLGGICEVGHGPGDRGVVVTWRVPARTDARKAPE